MDNKEVPKTSAGVVRIMDIGDTVDVVDQLGGFVMLGPRDPDGRQRAGVVSWHDGQSQRGSLPLGLQLWRTGAQLRPERTDSSAGEFGGTYPRREAVSTL